MSVGVMKDYKLVVYYESMERKLLKPIYECRCNGRLQPERFTLLNSRRYWEEKKRLKKIQIKT
jgi:hypothetical protein